MLNDLEEERKVDLSALDIVKYKKDMTFQKGKFYENSKGEVFRYIENKLYTGLSKIGEREPDLEETVLEVRIPLIPYSIVEQIHSFFCEVHDLYSTEAVVLLWYHFSKKIWELEIPMQIVSGASAEYQRKDHEINQLERKGFILIGTIHSHGQMAAFHSGTDNDDEFNFDGIHITIGRLNTGPDYSCRFIMKGVEVPLEPTQCIEALKTEKKHPDSWLLKVKKTEPSVISNKWQQQNSIMPDW